MRYHPIPERLPIPPTFMTPPLFPNPITHERINSVITRTKTPQLHLLPILDLSRIAIPPLHGYLAVRICIHQDIKAAVTVKLREEGDRSGDLAEDGLNLGLDLCLSLFYHGRCGAVFGNGRGVLLVGGGAPGGRLFWLGDLEDLHVELPPLDILPCVLVCDYDDQLGDLAAGHPFCELGHDFLDVGLDLVVGGDLGGLVVYGRAGGVKKERTEHREAIFLHAGAY